MRSVQKRLTFDMKELGSRDRGMGEMTLEMPFKEKKEPVRRADLHQRTSTRLRKGERIEDPSEQSEPESSFASSEQRSEGAQTPQYVGGNPQYFRKNANTASGSLSASQPARESMETAPQHESEFENVHLIDFKMHKWRNMKWTRDRERMLGEADTPIEQSKRLIGRTDAYEFTEEGLILVRDDFGAHIFYDVAFDDMLELEEELVRVGTHYLQKREVVADPEAYEGLVPLTDRLAMLEDLVIKEAEFQYAKIELVECFCEVYEHTCDALE